MITVGIESFERAMPELAQLFPRHHAEVGLFRDRMPLDPRYGEYVSRETAGILAVAIIRKDSRIVAYYIFQVTPGFHYGSTLTGTMDILYVVPEERGKGLARMLFRAVERELKRRGVKVWYSGYKTANPLGLDRMHTLFGFQPADTYTVKWLGG